MFDEAAAYHGVFAIRWAPRVGLTPSAVAAKGDRERWAQPYPGVVVVPGTVWTHRTDIAAALASVKADAAARGLSAAWLYGLVRHPPRRPHLLIPHHQRVEASVGHLRRSRHVTAADRTMIDRLVVLTPTFWLISTAAQAADGALLSYAIDARQRGLLDFGDVAVRLESMPRVPGRSRLLRVLRQLAHDGSDSVLESRVRARLYDAGFMPSSAPLPVRLRNGHTVHLDIAFPAERVAVECMGFLAHSSRRQLNRDAQRENRIALSDEWLVLKLTWDHFVHDWDTFVADLRAALARRRGAWR